MPRTSSPPRLGLTLGEDTPGVRRQLRELILYISRVCYADLNFGPVKLTKILWLADILAFRRFGKSITGASYQKLPFGPAPVLMKEVMEEMKQDGALHIQDIDLLQLTQKRPIALKSANLESFSGDEIAIVHQVLEQLQGKTGAEIGEMSHGIAWQIAEMGEVIPYETAAFLSPVQSVSDLDRERARALAEPVPDC